MIVHDSILHRRSYLRPAARLFFFALIGFWWLPDPAGWAQSEPTDSVLRVAAAEVEFESDDALVIGGSIAPGRRKGQEGKLRAAALVVEGPPAGTRMALVACDVLMLQRDMLDEACRQIQLKTEIPASNILINATHTHHAPTTVTVHGYQREEAFTRHVRDCIVQAVVKACERLGSASEARMLFAAGKESTVGQNSRVLLADGTIYWVGDRNDFVKPTGPFDPDLPVLRFCDPEGSQQVMLFGHSTHTIGTRAPGKRSPSFYGLAAQELEQEMGSLVLFLEGASGSTHNLTLSTPQMVTRIKRSVRLALQQEQPLDVTRLASIKRELEITIRQFDESKEDQAVRTYCQKRIPRRAEYVTGVFRAMRRQLSPRQGQTQRTWIQAMRIGEVAVVGVPGEFFTQLGLAIKQRSPFRHTIVAELANDWVGYIPDDEAYDLGGYQVWTGLHSYVARGTGEQIVEQVVKLLNEL